jgi:Ca2+-binding EF-hand superfamily protein
VAEFSELMASLGSNFTEEEAREKLKILDEGQSGTISKAEFIAWCAENKNEEDILGVHSKNSLNLPVPV